MSVSLSKHGITQSIVVQKTRQREERKQDISSTMQRTLITSKNCCSKFSLSNIQLVTPQFKCCTMANLLVSSFQQSCISSLPSSYRKRSNRQCTEATMDMTIWCVIILGNAKVCVGGPQEEKLQNKCALGQRDSSSLSWKESQLLRVKSVSYASKIFKCSLLSHR